MLAVSFLWGFSSCLTSDHLPVLSSCGLSSGVHIHGVSLCGQISSYLNKNQIGWGPTLTPSFQLSHLFKGPVNFEAHNSAHDTWVLHRLIVSLRSEGPFAQSDSWLSISPYWAPFSPCVTAPRPFGCFLHLPNLPLRSFSQGQISGNTD